MAEQFLGYPSHFLDLWQIPTAYELFVCYKEVLAGGAGTEVRQKFCRGLRKNLSGRWKRLRLTNSKKAAGDELQYTIPPHLRYQLKKLYVY